jgi:hypothetical protein
LAPLIGIDSGFKSLFGWLTVRKWTAFFRTSRHHEVAMPKKKLQKKSRAALLSEVKKEMAQPRAAASTQSEVSGASTVVVARVKARKTQK